MPGADDSRTSRRFVRLDISSKLKSSSTVENVDWVGLDKKYRSFRGCQSNGRNRIVRGNDTISPLMACKVERTRKTRKAPILGGFMVIIVVSFPLRYY